MPSLTMYLMFNSVNRYCKQLVQKVKIIIFNNILSLFLINVNNIVEVIITTKKRKFANINFSCVFSK